MNRERGVQILKEMLGEDQAAQVQRAWQEISPDFATRDATRSQVTSPSRTPVKTTFRLTSQSRKRPTSSLVSLNTQMLSSRTSVQE